MKKAIQIKSLFQFMKPSAISSDIYTLDRRRQSMTLRPPRSLFEGQAGRAHNAGENSVAAGRRRNASAGNSS